MYLTSKLTCVWKLFQKIYYEVKVKVLFKYNFNIRFLYTLKKKMFTKLNDQVLKNTDMNILFNKNSLFCFYCAKSFRKTFEFKIFSTEVWIFSIK